MQLPSPRTPIARCEQISLYTQRMLQKFPNEAGLAGLDTMLATSTQTLMATQSAYRDSVTALIVVRVDVKFADYVADKGVRQGQRFAQLADGGSKGRFSSHLYPDGTTPIVRLVGESQVTEMKKLEGRYTSLVGTWSDAATEGAKIAAFCTRRRQRRLPRCVRQGRRPGPRSVSARPRDARPLLRYHRDRNGFVWSGRHRRR